MLELGQKVHDLGRSPIDCSNELAAHDAVSINDVSLRILEGPIKVAAFLVAVAYGQKLDLTVLQELVIRVRVDVDANAQKHNPFVLYFLIQLNQRRKLLNAGRTPSCPEVEDDNFSA